MVAPTGIEPARISPSDFKSDVFANFTTGRLLNLR